MTILLSVYLDPLFVAFEPIIEVASTTFGDAVLESIGDIFDYWFEYSKVIPKGFTRLLGKLAELRDANLPIYFFTGNHDMWMFRYFTDEMGIPIYREPIIRDINGKRFFIGHGDGLGPGDYGYKFI